MEPIDPLREYMLKNGPQLYPEFKGSPNEKKQMEKKLEKVLSRPASCGDSNQGQIFLEDMEQQAIEALKNDTKIRKGKCITVSAAKEVMYSTSKRLSKYLFANKAVDGLMAFVLRHPSRFFVWGEWIYSANGGAPNAKEYETLKEVVPRRSDLILNSEMNFQKQTKALQKHIHPDLLESGGLFRYEPQNPKQREVSMLLSAAYVSSVVQACGHEGCSINKLAAKVKKASVQISRTVCPRSDNASEMVKEFVTEQCQSCHVTVDGRVVVSRNEAWEVLCEQAVKLLVKDIRSSSSDEEGRSMMADAPVINLEKIGSTSLQRNVKSDQSQKGGEPEWETATSRWGQRRASLQLSSKQNAPSQKDDTPKNTKKQKQNQRYKKRQQSNSKPQSSTSKQSNGSNASNFVHSPTRRTRTTSQGSSRATTPGSSSNFVTPMTSPMTSPKPGSAWPSVSAKSAESPGSSSDYTTPLTSPMASPRAGTETSHNVTSTTAATSSKISPTRPVIVQSVGATPPVIMPKRKVDASSEIVMRQYIRTPSPVESAERQKLLLPSPLAKPVRKGEMKTSAKPPMATVWAPTTSSKPTPQSASTCYSPAPTLRLPIPAPMIYNPYFTPSVVAQPPVLLHSLPQPTLAQRQLSFPVPQSVAPVIMQRQEVRSEDHLLMNSYQAREELSVARKREEDFLKHRREVEEARKRKKEEEEIHRLVHEQPLTVARDEMRRREEELRKLQELAEQERKKKLQEEKLRERAREEKQKQVRLLEEQKKLEEEKRVRQEKEKRRVLEREQERLRMREHQLQMEEREKHEQSEKWLRPQGIPVEQTKVRQEMKQPLQMEAGERQELNESKGSVHNVEVRKQVGYTDSWGLWKPMPPTDQQNDLSGSVDSQIKQAAFAGSDEPNQGASGKSKLYPEQQSEGAVITAKRPIANQSLQAYSQVPEKMQTKRQTSEPFVNPNVDLILGELEKQEDHTMHVNVLFVQCLIKSGESRPFKSVNQLNEFINNFPKTFSNRGGLVVQKGYEREM